jgi:hypothetical protein
MGRKSNKIYVIGREVFVPHPLAPGLWIRTDLSVVKVACSYPKCGAPIGVPCLGTSARAMRAGIDEPPTYKSYTHWYRRRDAKGKGRDWKNLHMIIVGVTP